MDNTVAVQHDGGGLHLLNSLPPLQGGRDQEEDGVEILPYLPSMCDGRYAFLSDGVVYVPSQISKDGIVFCVHPGCYHVMIYYLADFTMSLPVPVQKSHAHRLQVKLEWKQFKKNTKFEFIK